MSSKSSTTKREDRKTYREERYDVYLGLRVSVELDAAIDAVAEAGLMQQSDCLRLMLKDGLKAWQGNVEARMDQELVARGVNITPELQAALIEESKNCGD